MIYNILFNSSLTPKDAVIHFLITIFVFFVSLTIHEFAHGFSAFKMGDPTAKLAGRLTLNPFKHLDFMGFLMFLFLGVGWAKPVPINSANFKNMKKGTRIVSISGVVANLILAIISAVTIVILSVTVGVGGTVTQIIYNVLIYFVIINSFLFMFNILPLAPLDGYNFLATFLKVDNKFLNFMAKNGVRVLIGMLIAGMLTDLLFGFDIFTKYLSLLSDGIFEIILSNESVVEVFKFLS